MIALSIDRICQSVMAASSLRNSVGSPRPILLEKDNLPALRRMAIDVAARILVDLGPRVLQSDLAAAADIIKVELDVHPGQEGCARVVLESAVGAGLLFIAYGEKGYADEWRRHMLALALLRPASDPPSRFYPDVV